MALDLCKYYKKQRFVSYNDGLTWQPLDEYERGELYEAHSASCGAGVFQYRWTLINNGYICDGKDRYTREIYQYSEDGTVWYNVWPTIYRKGALIETNSPFCDNAGNGQYTSGDTEPTSGDTPCPPKYEWNGSECICKGRVIDDECQHCDPSMHEEWSEREQKCVCKKWYERQGDICVYVDPLKIVKCEDSDGILRRSDVNYYESGWAVTNYTVGDCITKIGSGAFNGQKFMTSVTISDTVEEIDYIAFGNCKSLTSITIPSSVTTYGTYIFKDCEELQNIVFGANNLSAVTTSMFLNCAKLQSATWLQYNNITSIGENAFYNCYSLSGVILPNTLQTIGANAFYSNHKLENITIPSGVTSIGVSAFEKCSGMTFVNVNSDNVTIGNNAFKGCTSLTAATFESSGLTIGNNVFSGCTRLLKLTFTATVPPEIEEGDFDNTNECAIFVPCGSLEAYKTAWSQYADRISCNDTGIYYRWVDDPTGVYCDGTDEYTRQKQQQTTNGITWTDNGVYRPITLITHYSQECNYQGDVVLTVTNEDGYTRYFEPCSEQPQPSQNSKIFARYVYGDVDEKLCDDSPTLTSGDTNMSGDTYSRNTMNSAIIGDCVTSISQRTFSGCTSLGSIDLPNTLTNIGDYAFSSCSGLTNITIPSGVTSVGNYVFEYCKGFTSVTIPDNVTSVGNYIYRNCTSLINANIGSGATSVGNGIFSGCTNLKTISINTNAVLSGSINSTSVQKVVLGNNVTIIGDNAFNYCTGLTSIDIPSGVTSIGANAFASCRGLTSINIPSGVTSISYFAFYECRGLTSITVNAVTPPTLGSDALKYTNNCPIYVPSESVEAYKAATNWSDYANRIQAINS